MNNYDFRKIYIELRNVRIIYDNKEFIIDLYVLGDIIE